MNRYYIVIQDLNNLKAVLKKLQRMGIQRENLKITFEGEDHKDMSHLLDKSIFERTDLLNSLMRGAVIGAVMGSFIGLIVRPLFSDYVISGIYLILLMTIFGIFFGAWASSLIGISVPTPEVAAFERALDKGAIMLWVEVAGKEHPQLFNDLKLQYPDILIQSA